MNIPDWAEFTEYESHMLDQGMVPMTYNEWCKATDRPYTRGVTALDDRGRSIITIMAYNDVDAIEKIGEQLRRNPSRFWYYQKWEAGGFQIRWND